LLVPFHQGDDPVGTLWVASHDERKRFDKEDLRLVTSLAQFASAAVQTLSTLESLENANQSLQAEMAERERSAAALRLSQDRLRAAFAHASIGMALISLSGRFLDMNPAYLRITGYSREELLNIDFRSITHPDDRDKNHSLIDRLVAAEIPSFQIEKRYVRKDGGLVWVRNSVSLLRDSQGRPEHMFVITEDVTDRRQAELELSDAQSRLEATLVAGEVATWTWDIAADRVLADKNLARLFSIPPEAARGGPLVNYVDRIHPDDRDRVRRTISVVLKAGDYFADEYRVLQPDGQVRWVIARGSVERDAQGRAIRLPGVVVDITDRKLAEEQLARITVESERQRRIYETALSNTADFNQLYDLQGRVMYVNLALQNLWQKPLGEVVGKNFYDLEYPKDLADRLHAQMRTVIETKQPLKDETPYTSAFGERQYEYIFLPVLGDDGSVVAVAGSTRDITDRKAMEQKLRDQTERLKEADRRKDEFLATLAHELRNPLAPIRNMLEIQKRAKGDPEIFSRARDMMDRQLGQMVRLIDDLLDLSRISRGKIELKRERLELAQAILQAVEASRPLMESMEHEFSLRLPAEPMYVHADPVRLAQVFGNLINNACKYTEPGGAVSLCAAREGDHVLVSISDTGVGLAREALPTIFDMFTQVDGTIERSQGGLGIGLTLVRRLVDLHGGSVEATSDGPGKGSTFLVRLPLLLEQEDDEPNPSPLPQEATTGRRILVVDDNQDAALSLTMLLELTGNTAQVAYDGLEALQIAEAFLPEVILLDIGLPHLNGLEVCRQIREQAWGQSIRIVALTGWGQQEDRRRSSAAGFNGHLVKPVDYDELMTLLTEL
jgi:PAS domain S-box-containing protein